MRTTVFCLLYLFLGACQEGVEIDKGIEAVKYSVDSIGVPSVSTAVFKEGKLIFNYTYGIKDVDSRIPVTQEDPYHIGSITKSITATSIAYLVEAKKMSWETRIIDVFPELDSLKSSYVGASLLDLLSHSSGLVDVFSAEDWRTMSYDTAYKYEQRTNLMLAALRNPKNGVRAKDWNYANVNYTIAALMAQEVSQMSWEESIHAFLSKRLAIHYGIGWASDNSQQLVPKGHVNLKGEYEVWGPRHPHKIPISIQPAGDIYLRIKDLAKYGDFHITGLSKGASGLSKSQFETLHKARLEAYALGWNILPNGTKSLTDIVQHQHLGSGGTFNAVLAIFPEEHLTIAIAHNGGGNMEAISYVLKELGSLFIKENQE